jgi:hypothetical protein
MTTLPTRSRLWLVGPLALAASIAACDKHAVEISHPATAAEAFALTSDWPAFAQSPTSKVDILFMVDDSSSMTPIQAQLATGFSQFMTALEALPGGTPDLHLGVVTSSMGAGRNQGIAHCTTGSGPGNDGGKLHNAPVGSSCAGVSLTDHYLSVRTDSTTGQRVTNFGGSLADAFGCIAQVGQDGCGFEQQLSSVRHALDPALAPPENAGFLRRDAFLAVVLVTNEDDCSVPADSDLFDMTTGTLSDPLGPLQSYRCNEYGHLCLIDGKLQHPPRDKETGALQGCRSAEDGRLDRVADFVTFLKGLKSDPARVFFAAVTGPPTPYSVELHNNAATGGESWPSIGHSCMSGSSGTYADPAVRIAEAVNAFGSHGLLSSICGDSMGPVLHEISSRFSRPMGAHCVPIPSPGGPGCAVVDRDVDANGRPVAQRLPSCAGAGGVTPCWNLVDDAATCGAGSQRLDVDRGGAATSPTLVTAIDCTMAHP